MNYSNNQTIIQQLYDNHLCERLPFRNWYCCICGKEIQGPKSHCDNCHKELKIRIGNLLNHSQIQTEKEKIDLVCDVIYKLIKNKQRKFTTI